MIQIRPRHFVVVLILTSILHAGVLFGVPYLLSPASEQPEESFNIMFAVPPPPPAAPPEAPPTKAPPALPAKVIQPTQKEFEKGELDRPVDEKPVEETDSFGVPGGIPGSSDYTDFLQMGNIITSQFTLPPLPPPPVEVPKPDPIPPPPPPPERKRVGGEVQEAKLVHQVKPIYPPLARRARLEGTVQLRIVIGVSGNVQSMEVIKGHSLLIDAAKEAVRQWVYTPMLVDNRPVKFATEVSVQFHLQ